MNVEFKSYDGSYPNLCSGELTMIVDDKEWVFPSYCLSSGGCVYFDDNWNENVSQGEWFFGEWPDGYPEEAKEPTTDIVNDNIQQGCCGGCV